MDEKTSYNRYEYREAKRFLAGAKVVRQFSTPSATSTTYQQDGCLWNEYNSHLEAPEDDYRLTKEVQE